MKLVTLLGIIIAVLVVTSVTLSNRTVDTSYSLREVEASVTQLSKEVAVLRDQVAETGSLTRIAQRAREAGYIEAGKIAVVELPALTASR